MKGNVPSEDPVSYETLFKALRQSNLSSCAAYLEEELEKKRRAAREQLTSPPTEEQQENAGISRPPTYGSI
jgi:hypothetical protein